MRALFVICVLVGAVSPSAIPMWEYLTKNEKVMYLFNMFQLRVQDFCATDGCKQDLKNYGWAKLKSTSEDDLDEMDPFQRNSNDIIWDSVMEGHAVATRRPPSTTAPPKPNAFEDYSELEPNSEASARIETVERAPQRVVVGSGAPEYRRRFAGGAYSSNGIQEPTTARAADERAPLQGPWAVKVHPDGSPVSDGSNQTLPEDDDLRLYEMTRVVQDLQ